MILRKKRFDEAGPNQEQPDPKDERHQVLGNLPQASFERYPLAPADHRESKYQTGLARDENRRNFDDAQKAALVAFLKTLSDKKFITDPKFSDPFQ